MRQLQNRDELCEVLGVPFSDEQLDAITAPLEPAVIIAGAGTGKTRESASVVSIRCPRSRQDRSRRRRGLQRNHSARW